MTSKIYGDPEAIKRAENAQPGDKTVYVNMDAIRELPDEYEVVYTNVEFDPAHLDKAFSNVGSDKNPSWFPRTELMYAIGEACGISGGDDSRQEPIVEEIDINPMLMKPITDEPTYRRMTIGRRVSKYSTRLMEDGTLMRSSICTSDFNAWEYCMEAWSKEEMYTDGYSKKGKYDNKYDSQYRRRAHFQGTEGMKFSARKAETKAHCKTIRELAGLPTGFSTEDLKEGKLTFARVRRSREILKAETAARLSAISNGFNPDAKRISGPLFQIPESTEQEAEVVPEDAVDFDFPEPDPEHPEVMIYDPTKSKRENMISLIKYYGSEQMIPADISESVAPLLSWLEGDTGAESNEKYWNKAVAILGKIESSIPDEGRIEHEPIS